MANYVLSNIFCNSNVSFSFVQPKVSSRELNPYLQAGVDMDDPNAKQSLTSMFITLQPPPLYINQATAPPPTKKDYFVGDGGASWRARALKRAKEQAASEGKELDEVVKERYNVCKTKSLYYS